MNIRLLNHFRNAILTVDALHKQGVVLGVQDNIRCYLCDNPTEPNMLSILFMSDRGTNTQICRMMASSPASIGTWFYPVPWCWQEIGFGQLVLQDWVVVCEIRPVIP